jgi:hypothetical protein
VLVVPGTHRLARIATIPGNEPGEDADAGRAACSHTYEAPVARFRSSGFRSFLGEREHPLGIARELCAGRREFDAVAAHLIDLDADLGREILYLKGHC